MGDFSRFVLNQDTGGVIKGPAVLICSAEREAPQSCWQES